MVPSQAAGTRPSVVRALTPVQGEEGTTVHPLVRSPPPTSGVPGGLITLPETDPRTPPKSLESDLTHHQAPSPESPRTPLLLPESASLVRDPGSPVSGGSGAVLVRPRDSRPFPLPRSQGSLKPETDPTSTGFYDSTWVPQLKPEAKERTRSTPGKRRQSPTPTLDHLSTSLLPPTLRGTPV